MAKYELIAHDRIAIDLDKTILQTNWNRWKEEGMEYFGNPKPGALAALKKLKERGFYIIIHTCRTNTEANHGYTHGELREIVDKALRERGVPFDEIWIERGKPLAMYYIDDSAIHFESWEQVLREIKG